MTFPNVQQLDLLSLGRTRVTATGLAHLARLPLLRTLDLNDCDVDGAAVELLVSKFHLVGLQLKRCTKIGDAELARLATGPTLRELSLQATSVTDAGVRSLEKLDQLQVLDVSVAKGVTHAVLDTVVKLPHLKDLGLSGIPGLDDAKLERLTRLPKLEILWVGGNPGVTDAGLEHVAKCSKLSVVYLQDTKVTKAGVERLGAALPACKIEWDGGTYGPTGAAPPVAPPPRARE